MSVFADYYPGVLDSEVLQHGLDDLKGYGWIQQSYSNTAGAMCSIGAIGDNAFGAIHYLAEAIRLTGWVREYAERALIHPDALSDASIVIRWNDADGRTFDEVEAAWNTAINLAKTAQK